MIKGIVEGFYGRPWTLEQRLSLVESFPRLELNTYLYGPKDDLRHRLRWRDPYSREELAGLEKLIQSCRNKDIQFIYSLAPGLDLRYSDPEDCALLTAKFEQVASAGCRSFALLFDDIPSGLNEADRKQFSSFGMAQCDVANRVWKDQSDKSRLDHLYFCPTVYCQAMAGGNVGQNDYLSTIGKYLDPAIDVFWTGPDIVSERIGLNHLREVRAVLGRKPCLWDNLHANDYDYRRIYLGPYDDRSAGIRDEMHGSLLNPNSAYPLNPVPIQTFSDWWREGEAYQARQSYKKAIRMWREEFKRKGRVQLELEEMEWLGDLFYLPHRFGEKTQGFLRHLVWLLERPAEKWADRWKAFQRQCRLIHNLYIKVSDIDNRELVYSIYPYLWEIKEEVNLLEEYFEWKRSHPEGTGVFRSNHFKPHVYRGGVVAELQRRLPMDQQGRFPLLPSNEQSKV